jgi:uncharacterized protein YbjT (DUF2867 family)
MRILIVGAGGLIGSAVAARLVSRGDSIIAVTRRATSLGLIDGVQVRLDVARATNPADWLPHLRNVDAVVNCAGILQDSPGNSTAGVHSDGVGALFRACEQAGVRRVVHLSAVGVDRGTPTDFSRSKLAGDEALMASGLDWVILRPSVVIGRAAYGGSALLRGLGALPLLPVMPHTGPLQVVHLDDVVNAVVFFLQPAAPTRRVVDLVGPKRWSFEDLVALFRRWLRRRPARKIPLPGWAAVFLYRLGDLVALLGWRPPMRTTAKVEIVRGAVGDPRPAAELGIHTRDIAAALMAEPASVQERWFARLYLLKAVVFIVFAAFWLATGLISLGPGWEIGRGLMREGGVAEPLASWTVVAGALADIAIGLAIAYRPTTRLGLYAALAISLSYAVIGTILVPRLWIDPLGPMLKIWPVITLNLVALAIVDDR